MLKRKRGRRPWQGALAGAIGGAAGTVALNLVSRAWSLAARGRLPHNEESLSQQGARPDVEAAKKRRRNAREPGAVATTMVAEEVAEPVLDRPLSPRERERGGEIVHYAYGTGAGALYGVAAEYYAAMRDGNGLLFGLVLWVAGVVVALPALGLSRRPTEYSAGEHALGVTSHAVYGVVVEATRRRLRSLRVS